MKLYHAACIRSLLSMLMMLTMHVCASCVCVWMDGCEYSDDEWQTAHASNYTRSMYGNGHIIMHDIGTVAILLADDCTRCRFFSANFLAKKMNFLAQTLSLSRRSSLWKCIELAIDELSLILIQTGTVLWGASHQINLPIK